MKLTELTNPEYWCGIGGMSSFDLFKKGEGWYPSPVPRY